MRAGIFTYAWDLDAEGYDNALGRIASAGFDTVNLACAYHAGKFLLPHNPRHRVYFPEDGSIYFEPDLSRYGRIQPRVNSLVDGDRDPLRDLDRARRSHGLDLVAWTVCMHNTWLGQQYPECTMHNAFGDPYFHSLCPAHPDVQQYVKALVADIVSSAEVSAIQLESPEYMGFEHGFHHEVTGVPLDGTQRLLLGLSFNPAEIERARGAGIDAEGVRDQVAGALDAIWNSPQSAQSQINNVMNNPDFDAYLNLRTEIATEFLADLRDTIREANPDTEVRLFAAMAASEEDPGMTAQLPNLADGVQTGYVQSDAAARQRATDLREIMGDKRVYGMVRAIAPDTTTAEEARSRVATWRDSGVDGVDVYNYGFMTLPMLEAVGSELNR